MSIETAFWLAALGIGAYFLFLKKDRGRPKPMTGLVDIPEPDPAQELTPEEAEIANAREVSKAGSEARTEAFHEHKAALRDAEAKLAQADRFVREGQLDIAVPWLFEEMHSWPSWLAGAHNWKLPVAISEVEGGGSFGDQWVSWEWKDRKFKLRFLKQKDHGHIENHEYADFYVEADNKPVLQINCSRDWSKEFDSWHYVSADVLKVGPWIGQLIEYYHVARLADEKEGYDRDAEYTLGRAAGIELGETGGS